MIVSFTVRLGMSYFRGSGGKMAATMDPKFARKVPVGAQDHMRNYQCHLVAQFPHKDTQRKY